MEKLFFLFVSLVIFHHFIDVQSVVLKYKMIQNFQKIELEDVSYFFRVISHALWDTRLNTVKSSIFQFLRCVLIIQNWLTKVFDQSHKVLKLIPVYKLSQDVQWPLNCLGLEAFEVCQNGLDEEVCDGFDGVRSHYFLDLVCLHDIVIGHMLSPLDDVSVEDLKNLKNEVDYLQPIFIVRILLAHETYKVCKLVWPVYHKVF